MVNTDKIEFIQGNITEGIHILAPVSGKVTAISCPLIQELGTGVAITPTSEQIVSPINAQVIHIDFAIGQIVLLAKNKLKLVIQLPFKFVAQHGLGIKIDVQLGDTVTMNQPIMHLNIYKIGLTKAHFVVSVYWLNAHIIKRIVIPHSHVECGKDPLFTLVTK